MAAPLLPLDSQAPWWGVGCGGRGDICQGLNSKAQLQSGRSNQMVGLSATSGESQSLTAALGEALPNWNRHKSWLLEAPCWVVGRRGIWLAGGMGTRGPSGQPLLTN